MENGKKKTKTDYKTNRMSLTKFYTEVLQDEITRMEENYYTGPVRSWLSLMPIYRVDYSNFAHVLAKGQNKYPLYKEYKKNCVIITDHEHHLVDNGTEEERQKYAVWCFGENYHCNWQKFYDLRDQLKAQYPII